MRKRRKVKVIKFPIRMQKKLLVVFLIFMALMIGLLFRILYINVKQGDKYEKQVLEQQEYDSTTIPFRRGDILDSTGVVLATSEDVYNVVLDCKVVNSDEDYAEPVIEALTSCFDITEDEINKALTESPTCQYYVLREELSYDEIQPFEELQEAADEDSDIEDINGVWFEKEYKRYYPLGSLASSIIGFTSSGNVGNGGIEGEYSDFLNGEDGREFGYLNDESDLERTVEAAIDGDTVVTTIDTNVQQVVEEKIAAFNEEHTDEAREGSGSENIGVIIMNPQTGEIIAMADSSTYDLNNPRDLTDYYTEEEIAAMSEDEQYEALNEIWQNYCITETYEPGSTVKPFTVAAGLETGDLTGDEVYFCDGGETISGQYIKCNKHTGHGNVTIREALMYSCNDALMQMAAQIGADDFCIYQGIFNFGIKTNIDLPGEATTSNLIYLAENMTAIDLATNAFGQNFNVTMIQVATAFSSLVNGGYYYKPHVVSEIVDEDGAVVETYDAVVQKQTVSEETSETIKSYLESVVSEGTGKTAKVEGYSMGGKTGTAETYPRNDGNYVVSFIGCLPADDPELVIYTVIDTPNVETQANSGLAQQLTKDILTDILPYMNLYPDEDTEDDSDE